MTTVGSDNRFPKVRLVEAAEDSDPAPAGEIRIAADSATSLPYVVDDTGTVTPWSTGSSIAELDDIPDVNAPTPSNLDVLTWDSTPGEWIAAAPAGGGGGAGGRGEDADKYNPDHETPTTAPDDAEEFNGSTGMAWTSAPGTDDLTSLSGFYRFQGTTTERHLSKAWAPGATDVTLACKMSVTVGTTTAGSVALYAGDTTGNPANGVLALLQMVSGGNTTVALFTENGAGSFALVGSEQNWPVAGSHKHVSLYLRLTRVVSGPTWTAYASLDGLAWFPCPTTSNKALTIAAFGIRTDSNHEVVMDWIRVWDSVVTHVGA